MNKSILKDLINLSIEEKIQIIFEMAFIDLITLLGYRENKPWERSEESDLNKIAEISKRTANKIMKEINSK